MDYLRRRFSGNPAGTQQESSNQPLLAPSTTNTAASLIEPEPDQDYVPVRFLENRIKSLSRTSVPHDLGRLKQHKENMEILHREGNWAKLNSEQINAARTVQQLKSHISTLDELKQQVDPKEIATFNALTASIRTEILSAIEEYNEHTAMMTRLARDIEDQEQSSARSNRLGDQKMMMERQEVHQSWEELRTDLLELNELVKVLNTQVQRHRETVAEVESRVSVAADQIQEGNISLSRAKRMRAYLLPVGGAILGGVVGGVVGGPVGILAGAKVGTLTAATVGTAGALGGAYIGYLVKGKQSDSLNNDQDKDAGTQGGGDTVTNDKEKKDD